MLRRKMLKNLGRRDFISQSALAGLGMGLPQFLQFKESINWSAFNNESRMPVSNAVWRQYLKNHRVPYEGLVTSLKSENNYVCAIKGQLPNDISGSLFRVGPGLFERGEMRRRMLIDADGMVRQFQFINGQVIFKNKHVRTQKFKDEEKANRYIYPSFSQHVPKYKSLVTNSIINVKNQASVCTFVFGNKLFVTDEIQALTQLNINNLNTVGEFNIDGNSDTKYLAHYKITNFQTKKLHLAAYNPVSGSLKMLTYDENFKCIESTKSVKVSRSFHDWHVTKDYYIILLPPVYLENMKLAEAMVGLLTAADAMSFRNTEKAQILIIPRDGREAKLLSLPESLDSLHAVNAFQRSESEIIFDFVASKTRTSIASNRSVLTKIMRGEIVQNGSLKPTSVYRTIINYNNNHIKYGRNYFNLNGIEMPTIDARLYGKSYSNAYFVSGQDGLDTQLVRLNTLTGHQDKYNFGPNKFVTEPIFAPSNTKSDKGYLLSEVYSYIDKKSYLAVFDAYNLAGGPIAEVWLGHHLPFGIHGFWHSTT